MNDDTLKIIQIGLGAILLLVLGVAMFSAAAVPINNQLEKGDQLGIAFMQLAGMFIAFLGTIIIVFGGSIYFSLKIAKSIK